MFVHVPILLAFTLWTESYGLAQDIPYCPPSWTLLVSSSHLDPCTLATNFGQQATCGGAEFSLTNTSYYLPPDRIQNQIPPPCMCTDIMYNLISACSACRSYTILNRTDFFLVCGGVPAHYDFSSTEIVPWMTGEYLPLFNVTVASTIAEGGLASATPNPAQPGYTMTGVATTTVTLVDVSSHAVSLTTNRIFYLFLAFILTVVSINAP